MHKFLKFIFGIKLYVFWTVPLSGSGQNVLILLASCMTYTIAVCAVKNSR